MHTTTWVKFDHTDKWITKAPPIFKKKNQKSCTPATMCLSDFQQNKGRLAKNLASSKILTFHQPTGGCIRRAQDHSQLTVNSFSKTNGSLDILFFCNTRNWLKTVRHHLMFSLSRFNSLGEFFRTAKDFLALFWNVATVFLRKHFNGQRSRHVSALDVWTGW